MHQYAIVIVNDEEETDYTKPFDLGAYMQGSTRASGVPTKVEDADTLQRAARIILSRLRSSSGSE
jgi:hypothetical protein